VVTVHPAPRVWIVPSGMFSACQGERDRVHSENLVVAGLRDPKTPLSAHDVIERPVSLRRALGFPGPCVPSNRTRNQLVWLALSFCLSLQLFQLSGV